MADKDDEQVLRERIRKLKVDEALRDLDKAEKELLDRLVNLEATIEKNAQGPSNGDIIGILILIAMFVAMLVWLAWR